MISVDDLAEIVLDCCRKSNGAEPGKKDVPGKRGFHAREIFNKPYTSLRSGRTFLSEYDVKHLIKDGGIEAMKILRISKTTIVSPLAQEWLERKGIRTVEDGA